MDKKQKDRHLEAPAEANRDKHINFIAEEANETDPANEPSTGPLADDTIDEEKISKEKNKKDKKRNN